MVMDLAREQVLVFARRFGEMHATLAMHAALPLGLTPELLHLIRINFVPDAPWIAEADLLLSALCQQAGGDLYEMNSDVREFLIEELQSDSGLGRARINQVAEFLSLYAERAMRMTNAVDVRHFLRVQQWVALAYRDSEKAAEVLAEALNNSLQTYNPGEAVRVAHIAEELAGPLIAEEKVILYAAGVKRLIKGEDAIALDLLKSACPNSEAAIIGDVALPSLADLTAIVRGGVATAGTQPKIELRIFLSLQFEEGSNKSFIAKLHSDLELCAVKLVEGHGRGIRAESVSDALRQAISDTDAMLIIIEPATRFSRWQRSEWRAALSINKPIVPILTFGDYSEIPEELAHFHAIDLRPERAYDRGFAELIAALQELATLRESGIVRILHLSDLMVDERGFRETKIPFEMLADSMEADSTAGRKPDLIAITGDVAFSGSGEEYALAKRYINELLGALEPFDANRVFIVPGNHDVNRRKVDGPRFNALSDRIQKNGQSAIEAFWRGTSAAIVRNAQEAFLEFTTAFAPFGLSPSGWGTRISVNGVTVGIARLSSAWLTASADDAGAIVGDYLVKEAFSRLSDAELKIALMHHPPEHLNPFDRNELLAGLKREHCSILMHGHVHAESSGVEEGEPIVVGTTGLSGRLRTATFNLLEIDLPENVVRVLPYVWDQREHSWIRSNTRSATLFEPQRQRKTRETKESFFSVPQRGKSTLSNIPDRNPFFTGRERVLAQLEEALAVQGRAALSGLGGIGKTQTALEYAHRHLDEYVYTFWTTADSREALVSGYVTIASLLQLPESNGKDQMLAVDAVKRWLNSHEGWLLILDTADDLGMVLAFLPPGKNGHVLLTSRATAVGAIGRRVEIREMGVEEGALFLLRRAKYIAEDTPLEVVVESDRAGAKEIVMELGGLPLALDQAGAYIEETSCGIAKYLYLYRSHAEALLGRRGNMASDHPDPVASTWALSFEHIERANAAGAELLRCCAFLYPDGIPEEIFREGASELGPVLGPVGSDAFALNGAISEILKYSLLRRDANTHTLEIPRLVQAVLKQAMDQGTLRLWAERAVRAVGRAFPEVKFSTWAVCERLLPQAQACAELINQWGFEFSEAALLLNKGGFYLFERGRYSDSEPLYQQALAILEKVLGSEHPDVATSLNNLAVLYAAQGQYAKAEPLYQRAVAIREKALGPEHPDLAWSLNDLAELYAVQGQYSKAERLYHRALVIEEKALGPGHPDVASSLNGLAGLYQMQGRYLEAEPLYQRSAEICEKVLGPNHPLFASSIDSLGVLYRTQGQNWKAESFFQRALAVREETLGQEHPDVAQSLHNLAQLRRNQGRYEGAELLFQRALEIREKTLGLEHPDVASSLNGLAALYATLGQYVKAGLLYRRALAIFEKALGAEHPNVAASLNKLAKLYFSQGHYAKAEPLYERAVAIREKVLGPEHPDSARSLNGLAALYAALGQYAMAEPLYWRAARILEKALGPEHPDLAWSLNGLAELYAVQGQYTNAERLYQRALAIREKSLGPEHPDVGWSLNGLAALYAAQGQYAMAKPLYERAVAIREKALGPENPAVAWSLNGLAELYAAQGQYTVAEALYQRALAIREKSLGPEHPDVAASFENYALLLRKMDRSEEAEPLESRAKAVRAKNA
jgi:tetratricopeptide (TPR) repeat protein/predicted MPP superfamily phosphohydrolase